MNAKRHALANLKTPRGVMKMMKITV
jgi:hypothetical protein